MLPSNVSVIRVLEYQGDEDYVRKTLQLSYVQPWRKDIPIRELARWDSDTSVWERLKLAWMILRGK